jgi:hypothetical protein
MGERQKGRACIRVDEAELKHASIKVEKPKMGEVRWGYVEVKELFDAFQSFLLLPDGYSIVGAFFEPMYQSWAVVVESADILLPPAGEMIPTLNPTYERTSDRKARIVAINLPERWQYHAGEESK